MNHVRPHAAATTDLRNEGRLELSGAFQAGAFDTFAHCEMRRIPSRSGRYNIPNVGIFLWRGRSGSAVPLVDVDGTGTLPLRDDKPLFNAPRTEQDVTHLAEPLDVPVPLLRRFTKAHLKELYGAGRSLLLEAETATTSPSPTSASATSRRPGRARHVVHVPEPSDTHVAVDPVLGRVAFAAAPAAGETRLATFHYGSALAVGGGGYDRTKSLELMHTVVPVEGGGPLGPPLASVAGGGAVQIQDSRTYAAPATITATTPRRTPTTATRVQSHAPRALAHGPAQARDGPGHDVPTASCSRARRS